MKAPAMTAFMPLLVALSTASVNAQNLLPPGPGWSVSGPSILADRLSVSAGVIEDRNEISRELEWWLALSNPYSVKDLAFTEAFALLPVKSVALGAGWRQLRGDGMSHASAEMICRRVIAINRARLYLGAAAGYHIISCTRSTDAGYYRLGLAAESAGRWRIALLFNRRTERRDTWLKEWTGLALAWQQRRYVLRAGCLMAGRELFEPALSLACHIGRLRIDVGAWGSPPLPAAGVHLPVGNVCWSVEGRWVPALGLNLLWSISSPLIWEK